MKEIVRKLHVRVEKTVAVTGEHLRKPYGLWGLGAISFVESALVVPIVTDPFLIAYILANRNKAVRGVLVTLITSLMGGLVAYFSAVGFFEVIITPLISDETIKQIQIFSTQFTDGAFLLTLAGAVTPVPYTLVAIAAGLVKASVFAFVAASFLGRGGRYAVVGWLTYRFGERAIAIARRQIVFATILCGLLFVFYVIYKMYA